MRVIIFNGNKIFAEALFLSLCVILVAWILYSSGIGIIILLVFLAIPLTIITMHCVGVGRKIKLDRDGMELSFLWIKKKYIWDQLVIKQLFDDRNLLGYRIPYTSGIILSYRRSSRPKWMHPLQYCIMFHPFSYVVLHFPIKEQISDLYLKACYEVDKETLLQLLDSFGVKLDVVPRI